MARELKYFSPDTNYSALERELTTPSSDEPDYSKWIDAEEDDEDSDDDEDEDELFQSPEAEQKSA